MLHEMQPVLRMGPRRTGDLRLVCAIAVLRKSDVATRVMMTAVRVRWIFIKAEL